VAQKLSEKYSVGSALVLYKLFHPYGSIYIIALLTSVAYLISTNYFIFPSIAAIICAL